MTNDVHSENFESKLDPYFTSAYVETRFGKYQLWSKEEARSALTTTRPLKSNSPVVQQPV